MAAILTLSTPVNVRWYLETALAHPDKTELLPFSSDTDAQVVQDEIWRVLDSPALPRAASGSIFFSYRNQLRRLSVKVAMKYDKFPSLLILQGVQRLENRQGGAGGFADVYCGMYRGAKVALKVLRTYPTMSNSEVLDLKKSFYRESLLWKNLVHDHVLPFLGVAEDVYDDKPGMVIPWMECGNLRQHIRTLLTDITLRDEAFEKLVIRGLHQAALGLEYLHFEGIVHGDLHGGNILVDKDGSVRLTDFGLSLIAAGTGYNYGSRHGGGATRWSAPELFDPEAFNLLSTRPTFLSDVYAFACTILELYSGKYPWADLSDHQVPLRVVRGDRPPRPQLPRGGAISKAVWSLTQSCWDHHIPARPSAEIVSNTLDRILNSPSTNEIERSRNPQIEAYLFLLRSAVEREQARRFRHGPRAPADWLEGSLQRTTDFYRNGPREALSWLLLVEEQALLPPDGVFLIDIDYSYSFWPLSVYAGRQWHGNFVVFRETSVRSPSRSSPSKSGSQRLIDLHQFDPACGDEELADCRLMRRSSMSGEYEPQELLVASTKHVQWISVSGSFSPQTLGARPVRVDHGDIPGTSHAAVWPSPLYPWESLWILRAPAELQAPITACIVERRDIFESCTFEAHDLLTNVTVETFEILCHV